ncbi:TolC family protein [Stieleria sp. TO1_6]|nr:TolC family protein [Stieleria tagensis]
MDRRLVLRVSSLLAVGTIALVPGCSRKYYRVQADQDVAAIYQQKRCEENYTLPPLPGIQVDPRSRLYDPSPPDCPALPVPVPQLNDYQLPPLATGDPSASIAAAPSADSPAAEMPTIEMPAGDSDMELIPATEGIPDDPQMLELNPAEPAPIEPLPQAQQELPQIQPVSGIERLPPVHTDLELSPEKLQTEANEPAQLAELIRFQADQAGGILESDETSGSTAASEDQESSDADGTAADGPATQNGLRIVPIPQEYWGRLPESCVPRMLEFDSVQQEFYRSFPKDGSELAASFQSDAPRLTLPNIVELATLNSREYQTQKERLYRVALSLTLERYQYVLRPTARGNGTDLNYSHVRVGGTTINGLGIPTEVAVRKTTATAGQFLARFANEVVLTFNGPQGFSANVASDLFFEFQQSIFQRDVVFENLTQAERDVIYAARDLVRYRRGMFVDLASRYYRLLQTYRSIEISTQDYFSNLRAFLQGRAEYLQAGRIPRLQVDQFEQNALRSRSSLVRNCNDLESDLDGLKLMIGLQPEMPLNINLDELESLTNSDELTVTRQLVSRTKQTLLDASENRLDDRDAAVNGATVLINRLADSLRIRREIEGNRQATEDELMTEQIGRRLALLEARLQGDQLEAIRDRELQSDLPPRPLIQFARTLDLIEARLLQSQRALQTQTPVGSTADLERTLQDYQDELADLRQQWEQTIETRELDRLPVLVGLANNLLERTVALAGESVGELLPADATELEALILQTVNDAIELVDRVESSQVGGLDDAEIDGDEAMLLALYQRLDLMNVRGELADARRQIKLRADDLRAILDIRAAHVLRTDSGANQPFDFTFDDSTTQLSLALDTPLNRRRERNNYRSALINYNASRRALIEQEDTIKFGVRNDLRQLRLRRNQYEIAVASAALAYERVVSTRLQLQLAVGNVVARDFLEAQQAYTSALSAVASEHISFILSRIDLFLDTESIRLDTNGYWTGTTEESLALPPRPDFYDANPNPYGRLPAFLHYSEEVRRNH